MTKETWLQLSLSGDPGKTIRISVSPFGKWPRVTNYFQNRGKDQGGAQATHRMQSWKIMTYIVCPPCDSPRSLFPVTVASPRRAVRGGLSLWTDFIFLPPQRPRDAQSCSLLASLIRSKKWQSFWFPLTFLRSLSVLHLEWWESKQLDQHSPDKKHQENINSLGSITSMS